MEAAGAIRGAALLLVAGALAVMLHGSWDWNGDGVVRIACLGDSNTQAGWPTSDVVRWCEMAARLRPEWQWVDYGAGGATVCDPGIPAVGGWMFPWAEVQLARAVDADVIVAAFGTNDIGALRQSPEHIVACYQALVRAAAPRPVWIALTPPLWGKSAGDQPRVEELNARLRDAFPAARLVDFASGMDVSLFVDDVHLNEEGQERRAQVVARTLR